MLKWVHSHKVVHKSYLTYILRVCICTHIIHYCKRLLRGAVFKKILNSYTRKLSPWKLKWKYDSHTHTHTHFVQINSEWRGGIKRITSMSSCIMSWRRNLLLKFVAYLFFIGTEREDFFPLQQQYKKITSTCDRKMIAWCYCDFALCMCNIFVCSCLL